MAPMTNADESPTNRLTLFPIYLSLFVVSTLCHCLATSCQAYIFKRPAKKAKFLSKNKQIFDIYNIKNALKKVRPIRKTVSSCFAAYGIIVFGKKVKQSDLFVEVLCFCLLKVWNIFFVFRR